MSHRALILYKVYNLAYKFLFIYHNTNVLILYLTNFLNFNFISNKNDKKNIIKDKRMSTENIYII